MGLTILHCCHGLSFLQSFPTELDLSKAGLLSPRSTLGMHCYPTFTGDTGEPHVLQLTMLSKALKSLWWVLTRAAESGGECRSLPIHVGWGRGNSTSDQISSSSAKQPSNKTFALSYQLKFLHKVPQFCGHVFHQVLKNKTRHREKKVKFSEKLQMNNLSSSKKWMEGEKYLFS